MPDPSYSVGSSHQREGVERRGLEGLGISFDGVILTLKRGFLRVLDQRRHPEFCSNPYYCIQIFILIYIAV